MINQRLIKIVPVLILIAVCHSLFAAEDVFIRDILDSPQRYYNLQVQIQGEVTDVQNAPNPQTRGFYVLMDNSDKTIKVVANTLPAPGKNLIVNGIVQVDTQTQEPYLREVSRVQTGLAATRGPRETGSEGEAPLLPKKEGLSTTVIILIALIALVLIILLIVLFKRPQPQAPRPAAEAPAPQPEVEAGTRQVSIEEVDRQVGGLKTKQVPQMLAELRVLSGSLSGKSFPLSYENSIGRISGDIPLEDASVSREHARISFVDNEYVLENRSQTNPVILNSERLPDRKVLHDGDEIVCGVIKLQFKLI
jgi:hypothetical protein